MFKNCKQCNKEFQKPVTCSLKDWTEVRQFCSHKCHSAFKKNKLSSSPGTTFKKGHRTFSDSDQRKKRYGADNNLWKGGQIELTCKVCSEPFRVDPYREKTAKTCSRECQKAWRRSDEFRLRQSEVHRNLAEEKLRGIRSYITGLDKIIRKSAHYKIWRREVFKRDDFTCQKCNKRGDTLQADHIKQFALILFENDVKTFEEALWCVELWDVTNGRTLCTDCHKKTPTYARKILINQ